jgi:hypothetical protein
MITVCFGKRFAGGIEKPRVDVTQANDINRLGGSERVEIGGSSTANANERNLQTIVRAGSENSPVLRNKG